MELEAIDVHTHVATPEALGEMASMGEAFRTAVTGTPIEETVRLYREQRMMAIVFMIDRETRGQTYLGNDYVADLARPYPDTLIGFASVDPWKGDLAVAEARRAVRELGLRGIKLMPLTQEFYADDPRFSPLFEEIASLGVPVTIHVGTTGVGAGVPGGEGVQLSYGRPVPHLDVLAARFPRLTIVAAHPGWPWHDELLAVMVHKSNVWMDLSGWSPRYLPASVIQYASTLLQDRVMFGTDYPLITPARWLRDFAEAPFKDAVRGKILLDNARRLLNVP